MGKGIDVRKPTPQGKWEKASNWSLFIVMPIAFTVFNLVHRSLGFWPAALAVLVIFLTISLLMRRPVAAAYRRRMDQDAERGVFECSIRYVHTRPGSLRQRWSLGYADVSAETMKFQALLGLHGPLVGSAVVFSTMVALGPRELAGRRPGEVRRNYRIRAFATDQGEIEVAASPRSLDILDRHLRQGNSES